MVQEIYHVVEHDGGWAYKVADVFSETFSTHEAALEAAKIVARRQQVGGDNEAISYQDDKGLWHVETAPGNDRPETDVVDGD